LDKLQGDLISGGLGYQRFTQASGGIISSYKGRFAPQLDDLGQHPNLIDLIRRSNSRGLQIRQGRLLFHPNAFTLRG
jgi:hypothetical protein